jgi:hypothetical protein
VRVLLFSLFILIPVTAFSAETCPIFKIQLRPKLAGGKTPLIGLAPFWSIHSGAMEQILLTGSKIRKSDQLVSYSVGKDGEMSKKNVHPLRSDGDAFVGVGLNFNDFIDGGALHKHAEKLVLELKRDRMIYCLKEIKLRRGD